MRIKKAIALVLTILCFQNIVVYAQEPDTNIEVSEQNKDTEVSEEVIKEIELSTESLSLNKDEEGMFYLIPNWDIEEKNIINVYADDSQFVDVTAIQTEAVTNEEMRDSVPANAVWYKVYGREQGKTKINVEIDDVKKCLDVEVTVQNDSEEEVPNDVLGPELPQMDQESDNSQILSNDIEGSKALKGWVDKDGNRYYYNSAGEICKGIVEIEGLLYYFDVNTGALAKAAGWIEQDAKRYFSNESGILYRNQFIGFGDTYYYMGSDGSLQKGIISINGSLYCSDIDGIILFEARWIDYNGKRYRSNEKGVLYSNQFISFGDVYYYLGDDSSVKKGNFELGNKLYHANTATGQIALKTGWVEDNGKRYYANAEGVLYRDQFISFGNIEYYLANDGSLQKGIVTVGNKLLYADSETGIIQKKSGWIDYDGKSYFSNGEGILYSNQFISFGSTTYFVGKDGSVQKGVFSTGGKVYYTDPDTGVVQKKAGWIDYDGKKYFSDGGGILYSNQFISFGSTMYYLGYDGSLQKGVFSAGGKVYYTDPDTGILQKKFGWIDYNSKKYFSDEEGVLYSNQFISFGGIIYYMGSDGSVQKGVFSTGGKVYYTDPNTGILQKKAGWIDCDGKKYFSDEGGILYSNQFISFGSIMYYMGDDGSIQKGAISTGGKVYYMDSDTGILQRQSGWIDYDGKKYFSNAEGILYSEQIINFGSTECYYMGKDGSVQKGIVECAGNLYYADLKTGIIQKKSGWLEYQNRKYFSNVAGVLYRNQFISFGLDYYYMGSDGSVQTGYKQINGYWYYFDEKTGIMKREKGWFYEGTNKYYQKSDGTLARGYTDIDGVRYYFNNSCVLSSKMGIDVSQWQGNINWSKVKNAGVEFAFIRVAYRGSSTGRMVADSYYKQNIEGALAAGIKVGVYFFSQAITIQEAKEEANYTYNLIRNYNISFPVAFDTEFYDSAHSGRADSLSSVTRTMMANIFCSEIQQRGYTPMVYASTSFLYNNLQTSLLSNYQTWVAQYNSKLTYTGNYKCWQYSSTGRVDGVSGNTDMNVWLN